LALRSELEQRKSEVEQRHAEGVAERESLLRDATEGQAKALALVAATELEATLRGDCADSRLVVATRQRDLEEAEENLEGAQRRSHAYGLARRALIVGERTDQLLSRLLTDVTAEARPRISELMDSWARSLLSGRFTSLSLAEDYRIRADNGSGEHDLGHFSGGEQTLLSVILRVSISLFCRERAGFDTGFLILDEVFGDQDADHRLLLLEFLDEIQREYHQVLVVNHVEDVTAMLDSIIEVRRTGPNTSTASIRDG
jgi:DNA repair exonuclease SbcCD ATPase subunit